MPRPRRAARARRGNLSPGALAFFRGEPMPPPGPDRDDFVGLTYFGNVVRGRRTVPLEQLRAEFEQLPEVR